MYIISFCRVRVSVESVCYPCRLWDQYLFTRGWSLKRSLAVVREYHFAWLSIVFVYVDSDRKNKDRPVYTAREVNLHTSAWPRSLAEDKCNTEQRKGWAAPRNGAVGGKPTFGEWCDIQKQ